MQTLIRVVPLLITLLFTASTLTGCFSHHADVRGGKSSSLVEYLYPKGEQPPAPGNELPVLQLPLRVGLAFVPGNNHSGLSIADQQVLLGRVKDAFAHHSFIQHIEVIPDVYLRGGKGFDTLAQVGRLHSVDVMALVSYDQIANLTDNKAAITYWTIVGAYFVKGSDGNVQTFVDTAVFDLRSRKLLFRAPGLHAAQRSTTLVNAEADMQQAQQQSFVAAVDDMNKNLDAALTQFRERVKSGQGARVVRSGGGGGGVAFGLLMMGGVILVMRRRGNSAESCLRPHEDLPAHRDPGR